MKLPDKRQMVAWLRNCAKRVRRDVARSLQSPVSSLNFGNSMCFGGLWKINLEKKLKHGFTEPNLPRFELGFFHIFKFLSDLLSATAH